MEKLIIVSGKATHGKDETILRVRKILEDQGKKCLRIAVGDALKNVCKMYFGWDGVKDEKGRTILQYVGTDVCRKNNPGMWARIFVEILKGIETEFDYIFVGDVRLPDEIEYNKEAFGDKVMTVRVTRINYISPLTPEQQRHITETGLDDYEFDYHITNDTLESLQAECEKFAEGLINGTL